MYFLKTKTSKNIKEKIFITIVQLNNFVIDSFNSRGHIYKLFKVIRRAKLFIDIIT